MAPIKAALFALVTLAVATQAAAQQATGRVPTAYDFVCDFKSRTTLTGKDFDDLRPERTTTADRLTFLIPTSACPPPYNVEESYYLSEGDSRQYPTYYPALKTWQTWIQGLDFYRPYTSTGRCHLF
jgi:hypothetical protein